MKVLIISICLFLFFATPLMAKEKPQVQVSFEFDSENSKVFKELIENKINEFKKDANAIIITGLNEYIGFAKFSQEAFNVSHHLKITLRNTGSKEFPGYTFIFEMVDLNGNSIKQTLEFVNETEFSAFVNSEEILIALRSKWKEYLEGSGTQELVSSFFKNIGFTLPDSGYYYFKSSIKQAILPFHKDSLMINHLDSEFRIEGDFIDSQGATSTLSYEGTGIGEVEEGLLGNSDLDFCIRIKIKDMDLGLAPLKGQVFIVLYQRMSNPDALATPSDFNNSNNLTSDEE